MKTKKLGILLCGLLILSFTGCDKQKNVEKEEKESSCSLLQIYETGIDNNFICEQMSNISDNGENFFITDSGELYEYSLHEKYSSTKSNCRKIETDVTFKRVIRDTLISSDGSLYRLSTDKQLEFIDEELEKRGPAYYGLNQMYIPLYRMYNDMFLLADQNLGTQRIYAVIEDNGVYLLNDVDLSKDLIYQFANGEMVEKVTNGVIMTNKGYYKYDITNEKECSEYADVECKYGIVKIDTKGNCTDIIYSSNSLVVTKDMVE